jgi:hypothetical protein
MTTEPIHRRRRPSLMKRSLFAPVLASLVLLATVPVSIHAADSTEPSIQPVYVESTQILYLESWPVQVTLQVSGTLPTPCNDAVWEVSAGDEVIDVRLWSEVDPEVMCATVLEPVELSIPLGSYEDASIPVLLNTIPVGSVEVGAGGSDVVALSGAGWSFGMCLGYCAADLVIDADQVTLTGSDRDADAPLFVNAGTLTTLGQEVLNAALAGVGATTLESTYGCPDCADGGAAYLSLDQDGTTSRHDMEFAAPPAALAEAYALAATLMATLEVCQSDELVTASPECTAYLRG